MKKLQIITILLFFMFSACISSKSGSKNNTKNWLKGTWKGIGYQTDGQEWETTVDAKNLKNIKVSYASLLCSGNWKITSQTPNQLILQETIKTGVDKCDQNVKIIIDKTDNPNTIKVSYFLPNQEEKIATADLQKKHSDLKP